MKRLSLVLTILFTMLHAHLYAATFTASQIEITPGQTAQLVIGMNNTETNLSGFQFKLYLPEGLSVTTNANGQFVYTQSGRIANHDVNFRALDDGGYLVVVYSMEADIITGSSGELMSISVTADETASTSGKGTLSNIRITDVTSSTNSCDDVPIDVTVLNAHPHDVTFTASQIEITPGQTAQLVIGMNNTETNLSGFQFKLYLPEGLSVTTDTKGQFVYTQSGRIAKHTVNFRNLNDGGYLVVVYSMDADVITGSSGELMSISVTADETASTSGNGKLSNIRITDVTSSTSSCDDVPIDIIIVPKVHYVTFKYGETVYLHEQVAYGAAVPVPDNPTLKGHTFAGWTPDVPETMPDEDLVFTAVFTVNQYTATFTIPSEDWSEVLTLDYGSAITAPTPPTKPGYAFAGWDKPIPETMPDTDLVFTGTYTQNFQTLSLTATGNGSISYGNSSVRSSSQSFDVAELSDVVLTITPDAGHHVETLTINGEDALSQLTTESKLSIGSMTASVTVAVTFAANVHDVTYLYGETVYLHEQVAYGAAVPVPDNPTLKGHTFAGWTPDVPETMPDEDLVFTAVFTVNQYTATFTIPSEDWSEVLTLDYGSAITAPTPPTKPGYAFAGWDKPIPETMPDTDLVFTGTYTQNFQTLSLTATGNGTVLYGNTSVRSSSQSFDVAELSDVVLTITPDAGHHVETLTVNSEDALSQLSTDGKLSLGSMTASVTVAVTFAVNVHDVTYQYGETVYLHEQVAYGAAVPVPDNPTLKGHTFAGWTPDVPETMPDEDLVFTAVFTVNQYTATFTIPSEDWSEVLTLDYGSAITAPTPPTKPGYAFAGWDKPIPETMPDTDLVFTGSYTQNFQTLSLTAIGNGSISYGNSSVRSSSQSFDVAELLEVVLTITPDTGHHVDALTINGEDALSQLTSDGKLSLGSMTASVTVAVTFVANVIDFADANVKALCIANWDTNGDGELDEAEAAAVTDLGKVFSDNQTITSFNELQYFTSLTSIGENAFANCSSLTSITIPGSVTSIRGGAFANCSGLTSITIPNSVTSIGEYAFHYCESLTSIPIPNSVTSIGELTFYGCSSLSSVTIPNSVTSIGAGAFLYCTGLTSIAIGNSLTSIGGEAFGYCENLASITIPNSVTNIGSALFSACSSLISIKVDEGNTIYDSRDNCNAIIETKSNTLVAGCMNTVIPESVTSIGDCAFYVCDGLASITIPGSVTSIGERAFGYCSGLTSIKVEDGNTVYDSRDNCNAIIETKSNTLVAGCMNTIIPESVTSIGDYAFFGSFYGYGGLTSITIPNSVTSIGTEAFFHCTSLTEVYCYAEQVPSTANDAFDLANIENKTLYVPKGSVESYKATSPWSGFGTIVEIPSTANIIDFADANIKALCVANWDTNGDGELDEAEAAAVENLGSVFTENQAITSFNELQYFTGLTSIGNYAFNTCSGLTSVTIPENVTSIGLAAFYQCTGLTAIIIPESVTSIGYSSFRNCTNLTAITIPGNVTSIGNWAFSGCSVLTSIKVYEGNTAYDSRDNCNAIIETATNTLITGCQNTVIPNSVTSIGDTAFGECSGLTSITIPNSVTSIGKWAFYQCTGLTAIIIPESVTSIGYCAFYGCTSLTTITIPSCVTSIGENAFWACKSLTSIKVDEGNSIYDSRDNCNAIIETKSNTLVAGCMNTVIHESVTSIGHGAFGDYTSLTSITIPESVTSIGESAFWGCIGLTNITSHIKEPFAIADDVFEGIPYETATLFVPAGTIDAYKATDGWKNFQNIELILQQLTIAVVGDGTVTYSGQALTGTTATFNVAGEVQLLLTPEEGCHIERVMVNHQDYTSQVTDGVLTLNVVDEDYFVLAEFEHDAVPEPTYVNYTIYIDGLGDVRVKGETLKESRQRIQVPQGGDLVLEFLPYEGQMVDKVTLNGETVTDQVVGNTLVVRDVQEDGTVSVIFMEQIETFEYAGIRYGVTDNTQRTLKVLPYDYSGHLSIPESFEHSQRTWQVQEIGNLAFANCEWLVSVKIPSSITKAGQNLFKRDTRLAAIQWDAQPLLEEKVTGELTNANMLYYVKDKSIAPQGGNVIVNGKADNIILSDSYDFYCPEAFKAEKIAYNHIYKMLTRRKSCQGWETLVLPFDVEIIRLSRNPDNPEIYPYESLTDDDKVQSGETLPFWLYEYNDDDTFTPAASIVANTPYIISMPNDVAYLPEFRLAGNVTFSAHDVDVHCTSDENLKVPGTQRHFQPSYQRKVMGNDCYLVNVDDSINHKFAEGSKFIQALRQSRPFEAYMISQTASVKPWYDIFEQIPTEIRDIPAINDEEEMANGNKCYDLSGRQIVNSKLSNCKLHRGIYIINGKKQVIK